jgi:hypothetical protein
MRAISRRLTYANSMATLAVVLSLGAGSYSLAATAKPATISACYVLKTGDLRIAVPGKKCRKGERAISWSTGDPSATGKTGPAGQTGAAGANGAPGTPGAAGQPGAGSGSGVATRWHHDADGDGYGAWYDTLDSPAKPDGYVANRDDCDDTRADVNPAITADVTAGYNADHDCDGVALENRPRRWYPDDDGDGFGAGTGAIAPAPPSQGYVARGFDCNDGKVTGVDIYPHHGCTMASSDTDSDGHNAIGAGGDDCDDLPNVGAEPNDSAQRYPGRSDVHYNGIDEDCDPDTWDVPVYLPGYQDPGWPHATCPGASYNCERRPLH